MASRAGLKTAVEIEARLQKRKEDIEYRTKLLNHHLEEQQKNWNEWQSKQKKQAAPPKQAAKVGDKRPAGQRVQQEIYGEDDFDESEKVYDSDYSDANRIGNKKITRRPRKNDYSDGQSSLEDGEAPGNKKSKIDKLHSKAVAKYDHAEDDHRDSEDDGDQEKRQREQDREIKRDELK